MDPSSSANTQSRQRDATTSGLEGSVDGDPCRDAGVTPSAASTRTGYDSDGSMPSLDTISSDDEVIIGSRVPRGERPRRSRSVSRDSRSRSATAVLRRFEGDGNSSDDSLPSMQTVSDSSDNDLDGWGPDVDEDGEGEGDEEDSEELRLLSILNSDRRRGSPRTQAADLLEEDSDWIDEPDNPLARLLDMVSTNPALGTVIDNAVEALGISRSDLPPFPNSGSQTRISPTAVLQAFTQQMRMAFDPDNQPAEQHEDSRRAEIIMKSLEEVPTVLIRRYEQLRKGSDEDDDEGCAICRDTFILDDADPSLQPSETELLLDALPFRLASSRPERVLAFPCQGMHLFHAGCLGPWLSRKTTCPTCRFDIDPDSLTLRGQRDPISGRSLSKLWAPPSGRDFVKWLQSEESRQGHSHPDSLEESTEPLPIPSYPSRIYVDEEEEGDDEYEESDSEDEWPESRAMPPDALDDSSLAADLGIGMPPFVARSMLAALSMSMEPAMGNEYDDDDDHPEMAFANDYDEAALSMLMPPAQLSAHDFGNTGEDEDDDGDSTDVDMPPLAEVSDDEDASPTFESDSGDEEGSEGDEEALPMRNSEGSLVGRESLTLENDVFLELLQSHPHLARNETTSSPNVGEPESPLTGASTSSSGTFHTSSPHSGSLSPGFLAPSAIETRVTPLGTGHLLFPLDLRRTSAASPQAQPSTPEGSNTSVLQADPLTTEQGAAHSSSPLQAIFRNFTLWQSPRRSPPPDYSLDNVD